MHRKLARRVRFAGIDDPKANLGEALDLMKSQFELTLDVNKTAFSQDNSTNILKTDIAADQPIEPMNDVPVEAVLKAIVKRISTTEEAVYVVHDRVIEITTAQQAARSRSAQEDFLRFWRDRSASPEPGS
jgi:hypothetical protein